MQHHRTSRRAQLSRLSLMLVSVLAVSASGCSLFVMAGKAIFGDPKLPAEFRTVTGTDLTKSGDSLIIICSAPHRLLSEFPSLQVDIADRVSRNLDSRDITVVPSGDVARWYDDHGEWGDYSELAEEFKAKFVVHIELREFEHRVPQSPNLLQGTAEGHITVHEISESSEKPLTSKNFTVPVKMVFDRDFRLQFPQSYPVPRQNQSDDPFVQGFMDRIAQNISQHFYDYRMSEGIH